MPAPINEIISWGLRRQVATVLSIRWEQQVDSNLCLLIGSNATGKSLFRRIVSGWCQDQKPQTECIGLSMASRAGGQMGVAHCFVYGDEFTQATGVNTGHTITTAIKTAQGRDGDHVVFWDEPDTGLSDAYAADAGRRIAEFALNHPARTKGLFVVTHRKALIERLMLAKPQVLFFGEDAPATVQEYLSKPVEPADLEKLYERSHQLRMKVAHVLNGKD